MLVEGEMLEVIVKVMVSGRVRMLMVIFDVRFLLNCVWL